jgi:hypothetical protein
MKREQMEIARLQDLQTEEGVRAAPDRAVDAAADSQNTPATAGAPNVCSIASSKHACSQLQMDC